MPPKAVFPNNFHLQRIRAHLLGPGLGSEGMDAHLPYPAHMVESPTSELFVFETEAVGRECIHDDHKVQSHENREEAGWWGE